MKMPCTPRRLLGPLVVQVLSAVLGSVPAGAGVFGWTLSASDTDPFVNSASPSLGTATFHLWLVCDNTGEGVERATFAVSCTLPILTFSPASGFTNAGTSTELDLTTTNCPTGPIRAGSFTLLDLGSGFQACLVPPAGGSSESETCAGTVRANSVLGFVAGASPPCGDSTAVCAAADLQIKTSTSDLSPPELAPFTLNIAVQNLGPSISSAATISLPLPIGLSYQAHVASGGTWDPGTGVWSIGFMDVSDSTTLSITVVADSGAAGTNPVLTARLQAATPGDPNGANDVDSTTVFVGRSRFTDLQLAKDADRPSAAEGDTVSFRIVTRNAGTETADSLLVLDSLPAGLTYLSHLASAGAYTPSTGQWAVTALAPADSVTLDLEAMVDSGTAGAVLTNEAFLLTADPPDTTNGDNTATATVMATSAPRSDLALEQIASASSVRELESFTLEVLVRNDGSSSATGVAVHRELPDGGEVVSSTVNKGSIDDGTGMWDIGDMAPGDTVRLTTTALGQLGTAGTALLFAAGISSVSPPDSSAGNDRDSSMVLLTPFLVSDLPEVTAIPAESVRVPALLQAPTAIDSVDLYVRSPDAAEFSKVRMTETELGRWEAEVPSVLVSELGVQYYCRARVDSYDIRIPSSGFANLPVRLLNHPTLSLPGGQYVMLGSAVVPDSGATLTTLMDELGTYDTRRWRYGTWSGSSYEEGPIDAPPPGPGRGFWMYSDAPADIRWDGWSPDLSDVIEVPLHPGWNQISSPLPVTVPFVSIVRPADVSDDLVGFDGSGYSHFTPAFTPGVGYWIYNAADADRLLGFSVAPVVPAPPGVVRAARTDPQWSLEVIAASGELRDSGNLIGMAEGANDGWDDMDVLEAPDPPGPHVSLAFDRASERLHVDFLPSDADGASWTARLAWSVGLQPYTLSFDGIEDLPPGWRVGLFPRSGAPPATLDAAAPWISGVTPLAPGEAYWTVAVGTDSYRDLVRLDVEGSIAGGLREPDLVISPNPVELGASPTISLLLPESRRVRIRLYDIQGRLVRTLYDGVAVRGASRWRWDARDRFGQRVATGVYFVALQSEESEVHRKFVLIR